MKARMEVPEDSKQIEILNKWKLKFFKRLITQNIFRKKEERWIEKIYE